MAIRVPVLTFRIHRFEAAIALLAMVIVAAATVFFLQQLNSVVIPPECAQQNSRVCEAAIAAFWDVEEPTIWLRGAVPTALAVAVGLLLGAPLVSRELELGTAWLSWSLAANRLKWFLHRSLPMLVLLVAGLTIVAILASKLQVAAVRGDPLSLHELGSHGPTLVASGFMTFGVAAFVGSLTGRTLSAFVVGAVIAGLLVIGGSSAVQTAVGDALAEWRTEAYNAQSGEFERAPMIWFDQQYFEYEGVAYYDEESLTPAIEDDIEGDFDEWMAANVVRVRRALLQDSYGTVENAQTGAAVAVGLLALIGAVFVVGRRRAS